MPIVLGCELLALSLGGVYRERRRHARSQDLLVIARATLGGGVASALVVLLLHGFHGPSRAALVLNVLLLPILASVGRLGFRLLAAIPIPRRAVPAATGTRPVLVYGAGDRSVLLMRELLSDPRYDYTPVGFVDDDGANAGHRIHGVRIFGRHELAGVVREHDVHEVLVPHVEGAEDGLDELRRLGVLPRRLSLRIE
jgi:FlaA1/EpsC-like NDP-sugar epimerase